LRQIGHGCDALPVTIVFDDSDAFTLESPVERSSEPLPGAANVFCVHTDRDPFTIGSGGPNLQPTSVQSHVGPAALRALSVQLDPVQSARKRLVAPSGVGPSGTVDPPPPRFKPPQVRVFSTVVPSVSL